MDVPLPSERPPLTLSEVRLPWHLVHVFNLSYITSFRPLQRSEFFWTLPPYILSSSVFHTSHTSTEGTPDDTLGSRSETFDSLSLSGPLLPLVRRNRPGRDGVQRSLYLPYRGCSKNPTMKRKGPHYRTRGLVWVGLGHHPDLTPPTPRQTLSLGTQDVGVTTETTTVVLRPPSSSRVHLKPRSYGVVRPRDASTHHPFFLFLNPRLPNLNLGLRWCVNRHWNPFSGLNTKVKETRSQRTRY